VGRNYFFLPAAGWAGKENPFFFTAADEARKEN
jgi:hypothetical protein